MEIKKKFEKNIFTEVIEDKSQSNKKENPENNNKNNINNEPKEAQNEIQGDKTNDELKISQKSQKTNDKKNKRNMFTRFYFNRRTKKYLLERNTIRGSFNKIRMLENSFRFISAKKRT